MAGDARDLMVVSHACAVASNQSMLAALVATGVDVELVVPSRWRSDFSPRGFRAGVDPRLAGRVRRARVIGKGHPQRHAYVARCAALLRSARARVLLIEEEPFSVAAAQWSRAADRTGTPFGVQLAETLERRFPAPVERWRRRVLERAAFVVARSPRAAALAVSWGATGEVAVVPHGVDAADPRPEPAGPFTVAYLGRLVEEKGVEDLLEAIRLLDGDVRLIVAGAGPLEGAVAAAGPWVSALGAVPHDRVGEVYARAHATCVPSRAIRTWQEQFGRVITESLVRGVPVVATSTGEIPWVLDTTEGGVLVAERDPAAIAAALRGLAADRPGAAALGLAGRAGVLGSFSTEVSASVLAAVLGRVSARR